MSRFPILRAILLILPILLAAALPAPAQTPSTQAAPAQSAPTQALGRNPPGVLADQQKALGAITAQVDALERQIDSNKDDDKTLVQIRLDLEDLSQQALQSALAFRPRLTEIAKRLDQLGPPPAEGQPEEPDIVTVERQALVAEKAEIGAAIASAEALSVRISDLIGTITTLRSELFRNMLTRRYPLADAFAAKVILAARAEFTDFYTAVSSWLIFAIKFKGQSMLLATLLALVAASVLLFGGRRLFGPLIEPAQENGDPSYLSRLSHTFWSTLLPTLALSVFLAATYFFYDHYGVLRGDIGVFLRSAMIVVITVFCVNRLTNAALTPTRPQWRLVSVEPRPARRLIRLTTVMAAVIGVNGFLSVVNDQMGSPLSLTVARSFCAAVVVGLIIILMGALKPFRDDAGEWRGWPGWLRYGAYAIGAFTVGAALLGYIGLAVFVSRQVVVTGTILVTAYIGLLSARAIGAEGGFGGSFAGRWLKQKAALEDNTLDQLGLVASIALNVLIVAGFLPLILIMWGFRIGEIRAWSYKLATGLTIGSVTISLTGILSGILVFVVGYFLTRWFQVWLDDSVMARGRVDAGVRNSIRLAVGYAGVAIAGLVGISAMGIDLSNLALVAGALSLGIGFGLQNVVSNFVSGLILLAERPFKVGDWIVAGDVSGTVKKISVRATEIETFQRQSVILPNSNLINGAVGNWTHRNKLGRMEVKVGVAYGSDVRRVHEVLGELARAHPMVLKNPEPFVLFSNFGAAALEFEIRVFLADITGSGTVQNDLRFAIYEAFEREGIEIPSAVRAPVPEREPEPWPADDDLSEIELAEKAGARAAAAARRRRRKPDPG